MGAAPKKSPLAIKTAMTAVAMNVWARSGRRMRTSIFGMK